MQRVTVIFFSFFLLCFSLPCYLRAEGSSKRAYDFVSYIHELDQYRQFRHYQDIPRFSDKQLKRIARGEAVIISQDVKGSSLKKSVLGTIIQLDTRMLWYMVNDRNHFELLFPNLRECVIIERSDASVTTYQYLDLPIISDRNYVTTAVTNVRLNQASKGRVLESYWTGDPDPMKKIKKYIKEGLIQKVSVKDAKKAILIKKNYGAWLLIDLPGDETYLEYYLFNDPEGALPAFVINAASKKTLKNLAKLFENYTEKDFKKHFNSRHEGVFDIHGSIHTFENTPENNK